MTAYANASQAVAGGQLSWEIRSVNHRYFDLSLRLPEEFRALEPQIRDRVRARVARGKVEASLRFSADPAARAGALQLNRPLARALLEQIDELTVLAGWRGSPDLVRLLDWPGLVIEPAVDFSDERAQALALLDQAVTRLAEARATEGRAIEAMLRERLDGIAAQVAKVRAHLPAVRRALETRFAERLAGLDVDLDAGRLEQEVALQLTRLDVDEELDRLDAHVAETRRVLELEEPVGRRLDFLMQEFNREANTLGSKSSAPETSGVSVELKVLIEQMREQVQNVE